MWYSHPMLVTAMILFLFSLAGIPPTAVFVGKFYLFGSVIKAGHVGLAVIGVLNSLISVFFHLRVIVYMTMREAERPLPTMSFSAPTRLALTVSALGTVFIGLFPPRLFSLAQQTISALMG